MISSASLALPKVRENLPYGDNETPGSHCDSQKKKEKKSCINFKRRNYNVLKGNSIIFKTGPYVYILYLLL